MRVCLLGEFYGNLDEGMRNTSSYLAKELRKYCEVLPLDLREVFKKTFWTEIKNFYPDIIHYLHGPTIRSLLLLKTVNIHCKDSKTIISATRPNLPYPFRYFIPSLKPDLVLVLSYETEEMFRRFGCRTKFFPVGVDTNRFKPAKEKIKKELRHKYGFDEYKLIILHIGSIKEGRNIRLLRKLQNDDNQVLIIGPTSTGVNQGVYRDLVRSECIVWVKYIKNIEEIYLMADCYIYPTIKRYDFLGRNLTDSIEMPLTVLEAMACNLPVITTRFGALPRLFMEGDGLFFADSEEDVFKALQEIKKGDVKVKTREKVLPYSWENIGKRLIKTYSRLLEEIA